MLPQKDPICHVSKVIHLANPYLKFHGMYENSRMISKFKLNQILTVFLQLHNISLGYLAIICCSHEKTSCFPKIPTEDYVHSIS